MTKTNVPESAKDAFRDTMIAARSEAGRAALAHQSPGREISAEETALAEAMMEIYATGTADMAGLARQLAERAIVAPASKRTDWDAALLESEFRAANESFDAAYLENGIGA